MNPDLPSQQRSFAAFARETSDDPCAGTTAGDLGKVALGALEAQLEEPMAGPTMNIGNGRLWDIGAGRGNIFFFIRKYIFDILG